MSIQNAENIAQQVAKIAWDGKFPVNPEKIVRTLNALRQRDGGTPLIELVGASTADLNGASGMAEWVEQGAAQYKCSFNNQESLARQRFTQAHELGHVMLKHVDQKTPRMRDDRFDNDTPIETDANAFAAELLMPRRWMPELFARAESLTALAETLGVSITALHYRLKNLRIA
ncbi:ImmA/IrrE family metallo-endopeptidase [Pseudidiomarina mangrovi]|uniref:ImmA/IrrE family metallo-endopeptidase n=1 Tax=Pseudidiomarina mangrovi TaxID=2487133 RepID=UPI000FC9BC79|nr:ImmA/IrrE family metallo-endopeptidase [Pseudidiomarina mangrovi]